jgi:hypothetical protein
MATRMQQRRGTAAQWISTNSGNGPILNAGEIGYETDTNKFKIGDGTNHWINLDYFVDANSTVNPSFGSSITFEGATDNAFETTIQVTDPTADRTITFPDATGTVALTSDISELSQDAIDSALTAGTGITKTYNDGANTLTIAVDTTTIQARVTDVSDTEIGYLNGVTSAIQTQLDDKSTASKTETLTNKTLTTPTINGPTITATGQTPTIHGIYLPSPHNIIFEGTTADEFETTLQAGEPTADRTITLPDGTGTLALVANVAALSGATFTGAVSGTDLTLSGNLTVNGTTTTVNSTAVNVNNQIIFEGATADAFETTLTVIDPTADRTITFPNATGTVALTSDISNAAGALTTDDIDEGTTNKYFTDERAQDAIDSAVTAGTGIIKTYSDVANSLTIAVDTSTITTKAYVDGLASAHALLTTSVHGIADTANLATKTYADNSSSGAVSTHSSATTNIHGISDTSLLTTTTNTQTLTNKKLSDSTTTIVDVTDATKAIKFDVAGTTEITGTIATAFTTAKTLTLPDATDTLVGRATTDTLTNKTLTSPTITGTGAIAGTFTGNLTGNVTGNLTGNVTGNVTGTVSGNAGTVTNGVYTTDTGTVTSTMIANGTIVDADINASAAIAQSKISGLTSDLSAKAPLAGPTFTGTVVLPSTTSIGDVSATELGYLDGVTSAIQTQLTARLPLAGGTMTGALTLSGAPTVDLHAATKAYVDNVVAGLNFHQPVRVATTANITLSGAQTIDGVSVIAGDRVLVKNQTTQTQNGIYVASASAWSRAEDADNTPDGELKGGDFTLVLEGTINSGYGYVCSNTSAITIGTTNVTYVAFNAAKAISAGSGLTESTPGTLDIATGGVTSAMIADGAIVDADINASAAIAQSKISGLTSDLAAKAPLASPTFTGTVTVAASGVAFTDGTQTKEGVPSRTPIIQKTDSYTLSALTERDSLIEVNKSSASTITIPLNATIAYPVGTSIDILQTGTGQVTIAGASGVTVNATPGLKLRTQWSSATLLKRAENTWVVFGDLTA